MIVATAGHIDHGKTSLVKALTGVDADRLPEEKKRGLTIDLGFAYRHFEESVLGFVDVPGHEKFVRNMLAGVGSIDFALLIVAADDGPMPQTVEHLSILDLLGVSVGAVALTKIDRVAPERVTEAIGEIEALLMGTTLESAPLFPVSSIDGSGIPALRSHLEQEARSIAARSNVGNFRLAIDRTFTIAGAGLVVTGTVYSGHVATGDRLLLSPAGLPVRVRAIHAQDRKAESGLAGERCALNITGADIDKESVRRGDWILAEPVHAPTRRVDATVRILPSEKRSFRHWTPVHAHLASAAATGRVAILEGGSIAPGESGLVQLVLDTPIGALAGDRFILRDQSAKRTLGGGRIVDPFSPARGRARPQRLTMVRAMANTDSATALAEILEGSPGGVDLNRFAQARNIAPDEAGPLWDGVDMVRLGQPREPIGIARPSWDALRDDVVETLKEWHARRPDQPGPEEERLRRALPRSPSTAVFSALVLDSLREKRIARDGTHLTLPGHRPSFSAGDAVLWEKIEPMLLEHELRPPRVLEIAEEVDLDGRATERFLQRAARAGLVVRVADNRYFLPETILALARIAEEMAAGLPEGNFSAGAYNKRSGLGRNLAIILLEFFDKRGFSRRTEDGRVLIASAEQIFGTADG
jgi:selenocysteine-specific elongation factor